MHKLAFYLLVFLATNISLYSIHITSAAGDDVSLSSFQNKKLLLVNIATASSKVSQMEQLRLLQQRYSERVTIIAFPSNSFGHEPKNNLEIKRFCDSIYHVNFLLAEKGDVKGNTLQPVYEWLASVGKNGIMQGYVKADFQKYLIDTNGHIIGVYAGSVNPLDTMITNAIEGIE